MIAKRQLATASCRSSIHEANRCRASSAGLSPVPSFSTRCALLIRWFGLWVIAVALATSAAGVEVQLKRDALHAHALDMCIRQSKATEQFTCGACTITCRAWRLVVNTRRGDYDRVALGLLHQKAGFDRLSRIPAHRDLVASFAIIMHRTHDLNARDRCHREQPTAARSDRIAIRVTRHDHYRAVAAIGPIVHIDQGYV